MARQSGATSAPSAGARLTDAFVIFAVTLVTMAFGAWLLLHLGLRLWSGMALALGIYATLLTLHLTLRRAMGRTSAAEDSDEEFDPWAHERGAGPQADALSLPSLEMPATADAFAYRPNGGPSFAGEATLQAPPDLAAERDFEPPAPPAAQGFEPPMPPPLPAARAAAQGAGPPPLPGQPQAVARQAVSPGPPSAPLQASARPAVPASAPGHAAPPEMSVEMIQDLIKKLADELGTGPETPPKVRGKLVPQADPETVVSKSISALQTAAHTMRAASQQAAARKADAGSAPGTAAQPAPAGAAARAGTEGAGFAAPATAGKEAPLNPQLLRVAEALSAERMDVLLEPIQALAEGRTKHFEITTRLLTADGASLSHEEIVRIAQGSGLMPRIDIARIVRAARVARRLGEGGRAGSVLLAVGGDSLTDHRFLGTASQEQAAGNTMRLVVSFQQSEVRTFSPGHMQTLAALAAAGFRFALDGVTDLDMDFSDLRKIGFEFVKLDAPVFLEGLPAPGGVVPANDITRMLSDNGLTLVVGRIDDDWQLARVLGFGVLFGRGALFGGPRLVKPEVVAAPNAVA